MAIADKVMSVGALRESVDKWRREKLKIIFTNGCFDIIHRGHLEYLEKARGFGDRLIVGVNSDVSVRQIKGPTRPIVCEGDRAFYVAALECVDAVTVFDEPDPLVLIKAVKPDILVKGADWNESDIVGGDMVRARGGVVKTIALVEGYSSTSIIGAIRNRT